MEIAELERAWSGLAAQAAEQAATLRVLQRDRAVDRLRARTRLVSIGQLAQLGIGIAIVLWAGSYWYGHLGTAHLMAYGMAIHLYGLGLVAVASVQLAALARLDYRAPVLATQRRLLALRRLRVRCERVLLLAGFVVWVPVLCAALHAAGFDAWRSSPVTVLGNLAGGLVLWLSAEMLIRRHPAAFERDAAGRSLIEAEAELATLDAGDAPEHAA